MQLPLGQAKCPSSHLWPWATSEGSSTDTSQVLISGRPKVRRPRVPRPLTLAVGLVGVVAAVVGAVADPRRVDAERGGVAADEILLLDPQHEEVRAVAVVWKRANDDNNTQPQLSENGSSA